MHEPFRAGAVLARSFSIWLRSFVPFTGVVLLVHLPLLAYAAYVLFVAIDGEGLEGRDQAQRWTTLVLGQLATGTLVYAVFQRMRGKVTGLGESFRAALSRFFWLLLTAVLYAVVLWAVVALVTLGILAFGTLGVVFLIPAVIVILMLVVALWVITPPVLVERMGPLAAFRRSSDLTSGYRLRVFVVVLILYGGELAVQFVLVRILHAGVASGGDPLTWIRAVDMASVVFSLVWSGLKATASAVGYHDLRMAKEGVGVDELARVFE